MRNQTTRFAIVAFAFTLSAAVFAGDDLQDLTRRSVHAAGALNDVLNAPYTIPQRLLKKAACVAVIPEMVEAGFLITVRTGKGLVSCRTASGWSSPSYVTISGGSVGLIAGGKVSDIVLVFTGKQAREALLGGKFTLGADVSVEIGPTGDGSEGDEDFDRYSRVYTYGQATGVFAGISIKGTDMSHDTDANMLVYGQELSPGSILMQSGMMPDAVKPFINELSTRVR